MKSFTLRILTVCSLLATISCKKTEQPVVAGQLSDLKSTLATSAYQPLTVITIAGKRNEWGSADGPGDQARFISPSNIKLAEDGSLYVIDRINRNIRKINTASVVSTVNIPASTDGQTLQDPADIFVAKDGTMTILQSVFYTDKTTHRFWIVGRTGQVTTPPTRTDTYWDYAYGSIVYDPYSNYLKTCGGRRVVQHPSLYTPFMEDLEIRNGVIGTNRYVPPADTLQKDGTVNANFGPTFCAYNGVKYFVLLNRYIYKLTPSGVFTRIYRDLDLNDVSSLIATKDSRTIYLVNRGKIEAISNGKKTFLVGPNADYNKFDGVGSEANVQANRLALSKDENTIYFTDLSNTVRKLILK